MRTLDLGKWLIVKATTHDLQDLRRLRSRWVCMDRAVLLLIDELIDGKAVIIDDETKGRKNDDLYTEN